MITSIYKEWHILSEDNTLKRALEKSKIHNILDYQKDQLDIALSFCKTFRHAIDVGANYGIMSANMAKKFSKVSAFEIVPEINDCFKKNMSKFGINNVDIYDCGLGEKETTVALNFNPQKTFSTHINSEDSGDIKVKSLDSFNFSNVDFIKIDAEGFEPFIIKGGLETIKKYKPVILYERKGHEERYGYNKNSVLDILNSYGYANLAYIGGKNGIIGAA